MGLEPLYPDVSLQAVAALERQETWAEHREPHGLSKGRNFLQAGVRSGA